MLLHAALLFIVLVLPSCADGSDGELVIKARPVPLDSEAPARASVGALDYLGGLALTANDRRFGGFSGLQVSPDGERLVAVSDRGVWLRARLLYDDGGRLVGMAEGTLDPILDREGRPVRREARDAEAVARLSDGALVVSFERRHRLERYAGPDPVRSPATALPAPRDLKKAPWNGGIEALTVLPDGRLLAVTEKAVDSQGRLLAWLIEGEEALPLRYRAREDFLPTDLALLPGGDLLVLERRYGLAGRMAARLRWVPRAALKPGALLDGPELIRLDSPLTVDNFEGLAVRQGSDGATLLYLMSDDNFLPLQRTLLLHFRLRAEAVR
ncbi:MAG: esterase-like activity of phytase family protein [Alphaproteobacteria bacterium]